MPIPADLCAELADILGGSGQTKNGICTVQIPRTDLSVTINGVPSKAASIHSVTFERTNGRALTTGDLVLLQDEVPDFVLQLLNRGIIVSAVHNHWILDDPHLIYVHVESITEPRSFARRLAEVLATLNCSTDNVTT
jgi:hypothetical protein